MSLGLTLDSKDLQFWDPIVYFFMSSPKLTVVGVKGRALRLSMLSWDLGNWARRMLLGYCTISLTL